MVRGGMKLECLGADNIKTESEEHWKYESVKCGTTKYGTIGLRSGRFGDVDLKCRTRVGRSERQDGVSPAPGLKVGTVLCSSL